MSHLVRIGALETACRFKATLARQEMLRRAVDTTCRTRLDNALKDTLDPVLDGQSGVIRIERLEFDIAAMNPLSDELARLIAARIAQLVRAHLGHAASGIQSWPTHEAYLAHFVLWRLGLRAGADWAFADFKSLFLVSPQEAAVEILASRPGVLATIAQDPVVLGKADALARAFDVIMAETLLKRLSAPVDPGELARAARVLDIQHASIRALPARFLDLASPQVGLQLVLEFLGQLTKDSARDSAGATVLLVRLVQAAHSVLETLTKTPERHWDMRLSALAASDVQHHEAALLARVLDQSGGHALVARIVDATSSTTEASPKTVKGKAETSPESHSTPAAGLALILPGLVQLDAARLSDAQRHAIALAALPEDLRPEASRHPGFLQLFPMDPQASITWRPEETAESWASEALAHFAERLPGLQGSSASYLQSQFLTQPGDVLITDETIDVALHRVPLAIVLSMGGHLGLRGRIPWLNDRRLTITIKGGVQP